MASLRPTTTLSLISIVLSILLFPLHALSQAQNTADSQDATSGPSQATSDGEVDSAAGAAGESGSFQLSQGAIIAIVVVAVIVGLGGVGSAVLFYIAKKRQWEIRKSIRRSARRLTGNFSAARKSGVPPTPRGGKPKAGPRFNDAVPETPRTHRFNTLQDLEKGGRGPEVKAVKKGEGEAKAEGGKKWGTGAVGGFGKKFGR
ncbi:MAG: hypothetical protein M1833_003083 [Piccolia ochrophora]|nr:MAG: hypothetical protein M1833_003083 [Piccolia ochrophora]